MRNESTPPPGFPTTCWSRVARAGDLGGDDARDALAELCAAYWYPVYALVRRLRYGEADALDLTQEYFARLLEKPVLAAADPGRGRFRAFLHTDCTFFLNGRRDRDRARKRGGPRPLLSIDACDAEGRYLVEPADEPADRLFERSWALTLLGRAVDRLASEYATTGRGPLFERLQGVLTGGSRTVSYGEVARDLGLSEAAVQQAASRLRRRYREALRAEIAATLEDPTDAAVESEIRDLFDALGQ
jgi:RNA polymerase sigma-70 factor (ECF subfamily)